MKTKIKAFWNQHKTIIIGASGIIIAGGALITLAACGKKGVIETLTKDEVIEFLKETTDPTVMYAIFKETVEDAFQIVKL